MSDNSAIEWTDATWNPVLGCDRVSPGCDGCYAITNARIRESNPKPKVAAAYAGLVEHRGGRVDWTGRVNLLGDRLDQPLRWTRPRKIFVNAQSDLFHANVTDEFVANVFAVMAMARQHTFQVLTKRHGRMRSLLNSPEFARLVGIRIVREGGNGWTYDEKRLAVPALWPSPNVWLGVSVEDQHWADIRIPALLETPAAVRWISAEPLLGPVSLHRYIADGWGEGCRWNPRAAMSITPNPTLDWVVAGGESGPAARPMHPDWARSLRDQCEAARMPYLFKQWGAWAPAPAGVKRGDVCLSPDGDRFDVEAGYVCAHNESDGTWLRRGPKSRNGRHLDGVLHDGYPGER